MSISATYIGVIILLIILIGFVLTVIRALASSAGARIRHDMNRVLSTYDELINSKVANYKAQDKTSQRVEHINLLKTQDSEESNYVLVKEKTMSSSSFIRREASHRDASLVDGYDSIKNEFREYDENIDARVKEVSDSIKKTEFDSAVVRVLDSISIDSVYDLCLDKSEQQLEFFRNVLSQKDMIVLDRYLETTRKKKFSTIEFYDWLKMSALQAPKEIIVRSGNKENDAEYYPSICEGCQIIAGNKLYDYSISKRDIQ